MTDVIQQGVEALDSHPSLEGTQEGYRSKTTPFEGNITVERTEEGVRVCAIVRVPTIDAVVEGETVAPVVMDGWLETFERRLKGANQATRTVENVTLIVHTEGNGVIVTMCFTRTTWDDVVVEDLLALIDFVEGTYMEGIIPGYTYGPPVDGLLTKATQRVDGE